MAGPRQNYTQASVLLSSNTGRLAEANAPIADKIWFFDISANRWEYLTPGANLTITGTTLDVTGLSLLYATRALDNLLAVAINTDLMGAVAGGMGVRGGSAANDDLILEGTTNATRTTSYLELQPNGGFVAVGKATAGCLIDAQSANDGTDTLRIGSNNHYFGFARNSSTGNLTIQGDQIGFNNIGLCPTSGSVAIGAVAPSSTAKLYVYDGGITSIVEIDALAASNSILRFSAGAVAKWSIYRPASSNDLYISDSVGAQVYLQQTTGYAGFGNASPGAKIDIQSANDGSDSFRMGSNAHYFGFARNASTGNLSIQGDQVGFNNIILCPTTGSVGIGAVPSSTAKLYVYDGGATSIVEIDALAASNSILRFSSAATSQWSIYRPSTTTDLRIRDATTDKVYFVQGKGVGIGGPASSTADLYVVNGGATSIVEIDGAAATNTILRISSGATASWSLYRPASTSNLRIRDASVDQIYFEQGGAMGMGGAPNANAILDVQSITKAFMPPRMTTTQKNAIASPTAGMVVYDSTLTAICVYNGAAWITLSSGSGSGTVTSVTSANAAITVATTTTTPVLTAVYTPALKSASTTVDVSAATAPSAGQALVAISSTAATWQTRLLPAFTTSDFSSITTAFANVTALTLNVVSGATYQVVFTGVSNSTGSGLGKVDFNGGSASVTGISGNWIFTDDDTPTTQRGGVITALGSTPNGGTATFEAGITVTFTIKVNAGGTLIPRYAQSVLDAGNASQLLAYASITATVIG